MVDEIYRIKNEALKALARQVDEKGADRIDGDLADVVKDLAEAEKCCWEAEYYRAVTEAMEGGSGYMPAGYQGQGQQGGRMGWQNQYGSGGHGRRGYSMGYDVEGIRAAMASASPEERERMRQELRGVIGA